MLEGVVKDAIERAFVDGKADLTTERLLRSAQETVPLAEVMKDKVREYTEKLRELGIRNASSNREPACSYLDGCRIRIDGSPYRQYVFSI